MSNQAALRFFPDLLHRVEALELMDDLAIGGDDLAEALVQLRWINRLLGGAFPALEGVVALWQQAGCPGQLSILDIGAGSGDVNRAVLRWATRRKVAVQVTLLDIHPETCAVAAAYYRNEPRVRVVQGDVLHLPVRGVDIVTASLFLHHFPNHQLPAVVRAMARAARLGVVINDLHRHPVALASIWLLTRLFSRNRMIQHDAPLSVRRGFCAADFEQLRAWPELCELWYVWRPLFRYLVVVPGNGEWKMENGGK